MSMNFKPKVGIQSSLDSVEIDEGSMYIAIDSNRLFFDFSGRRIEITDFASVTKRSELDDILVPNANRFYYVKKENKIYRYINDEWKETNTIDIQTGSTRGTISVNGVDVTVSGLGTSAFANASDFDSAGSAADALTTAKNYTDGVVTGAIAAMDKNAESADKLNSSAGSNTTPVYFVDGVPVACDEYPSSVDITLELKGDRWIETTEGAYFKYTLNTEDSELIENIRDTDNPVFFLHDESKSSEKACKAFGAIDILETQDKAINIYINSSYISSVDLIDNNFKIVIHSIPNRAKIVMEV